MVINITGNELEKRFKEIMQAYIISFKDNEKLKKDYLELKLILFKIASNLQAANLLWAKAGYNDAKILLRSAYESMVLFEYLINYPDETKTFNEHSKICEFNNIFSYFKRNYINIEELIKIYNSLETNIRMQIPFENISKKGIISYDVHKLEKFFISQFKPISQKVHFMMSQLKKKNTPHWSVIKEYSITSYNIGSQITHGCLNTLIDAFVQKPTDSKNLQEIKGCFSDSIFIIHITLESLETLVQLDNSSYIGDKIRPFYEYLGYDLSVM